jgi:hypothetical protein
VPILPLTRSRRQISLLTAGGGRPGTPGAAHRAPTCRAPTACPAAACVGRAVLTKLISSVIRNYRCSWCRASSPALTAGGGGQDMPRSVDVTSRDDGALDGSSARMQCHTSRCRHRTCVRQRRSMTCQTLHTLVCFGLADGMIGACAALVMAARASGTRPPAARPAGRTGSAVGRDRRGTFRANATSDRRGGVLPCQSIPSVRAAAE